MSKKSLTAKKKTPDVVNKFTGGNWVYTKEVKEHFFNPKNLLWENPDSAKYDAEGIVGSPACILGNTKIHANPKIISISKLKVGDKVLSHDGKFNLVSKIFRPQYKGRIVKLKTQLGDICTTTDHLIYAAKINRPPSFYMHVKDKRKKSIIGWFHAGDLVHGDMCLYPIPQEIKKVEYLETKDQKAKYDFKSRNLPQRVEINEKFLELAGYFVSDGYAKHDNSQVGFIFGIHEKKYARRVKILIKKIFNLEAFIRERTKNNRIDVSVYNVHLARFFRNLFGESAVAKHLPEFMMFLPLNLQRRVILGLWRGDGHINLKRKWPRAGYSTISYELVQQIKILLLRQKIMPSIYSEEEKIRKGIFHQKSYRIHIGDINSLEKLAKILKIKFKRNQNKKKNSHTWFDESYVHIPIKRTSFHKFNDRLFNLEVSNAHTYMTDAFLVHNCGDVMRVWLKIDPKKDRIIEFKWRTFGCASAIAATSMLSVMATEKGGMKIDKALKIKPKDIMKRLGGLPDRKIHCSVLGDKALRAAINDWFKKTGQYERIIVEGSLVIDPDTKVTEADIESAVIEGVKTIEGLQKRTKVGIGNPACLDEAEQLLRFYREKYFGKEVSLTD